MSKNLIPEIAKMLGVELGEEFKIKGYGEMTFSLIDSGLIIVCDGYPEMEWTSINAMFDELLSGRLEIVKLSCKPKYGEDYYSFVLMYGKWVVQELWWRGFPEEYALLSKGWVYKTHDEAKAALPNVAKELGVEYEL